MIPENLRYTPQHEWVRLEGQEATVGITDFAQSNLGDITYIELPTLGAELSAGAEASAIESAKSASSIFAPIGGKVIAVNEALQDDPSPINEDCYGAGWIYKLAPSDPADVEGLLSAEKYEPLAQPQD